MRDGIKFHQALLLGVAGGFIAPHLQHQRFHRLSGFDHARYFTILDYISLFVEIIVDF